MRNIRAALSVACIVAVAACGSNSEGSQPAYCAELNRRRPSLQPPTGTSLERTYADAARTFDGLKDKAPPEIENDVEAMTEALHRLADLTADTEGDPAKVDNRQLVEVALANKASYDRVNAYNKQTCGVDTSEATSP